jgi:hypothetical protein
MPGGCAERNALGRRRTARRTGGTYALPRVTRTPAPMVLTWPVRSGQTEENDDVRRRSRRTVLRAGGLLAVTAVTVPITACDLLTGKPKPPPGPDPLMPLITGALDLAARYEVVLTRYPEVASRLTPVAQAHRAHAAELARVAGVALPSSSPTPASTVAGGDLPTALAALRTAEQQGHEAAVSACVNAPAKRAALLGSIAAARATHLEVLQ